MVEREALHLLEGWRVKKSRKPLVIRGARQIGKSTLIKEFGKRFEHFVALNLDLASHRQYFQEENTLEDTIAALFFDFEVPRDGEVLIFLDEIQQAPRAVEQLRYFYEQFPQYHVIAAGSLLESLIDPDIQFPVGRVEFLVMRPVSFREYVASRAPNNVANAFAEVPYPKEAHNKLLGYFHEYTLLGGMPEVLNEYIASEDIVKCNAIFDGLLTAYLDDVEKYAASKTEQQVIRHCIKSVFYEANNRITFQGFGKSNYRSREVGEALRALEKAMIIHLVYPNTEVKPPLLPNHKRKPRLQIFDTGLMNYYAQLQRGLIGSSDISNAYQGKVIEHMVGQEILSTINNATRGLHFWVREKKQSSAEVDFVMQVDDYVVPVEVKSGKAGKLRSLHQFMEISDSPLAVRLYAERMNTIQAETPKGKPFTLLSLPYYLGSKIEDYVKWWFYS